MRAKTKWKKLSMLFILLLMSGFFLEEAQSHCYFNSEWIGEYVFQFPISQGSEAKNGEKKPSFELPLSEVVIGIDSIPVFGNCYAKIGDSYILAERSGSHGSCYRCIGIKARSANVLSLSLQNIKSCYINQLHAIQACPEKIIPLLEDREEEILHEFILVRKETYHPTACPFQGRFSIRNEDVNTDTKNECHELSNCLGSMQLEWTTFQCDSNNDPDQGHVKVQAFQCLGDWEARGGNYSQRFAVVASSANDFMCVSYKATSPLSYLVSWEENLSDCGRRTPRSQSSSFVLQQYLESPLPTLVKKSQCKFPAWIAQDKKWEGLEVTNNSSLTFRDSAKIQTISSHCILPSFKHKDRFLIFTQDQCGNSDGHYNCIWFQKRSENVLELQYGRRPSTVPSFQLCDNSHFWAKTWSTVPRKNGEYFQCPVAGEYSGRIPDNPSLCAKLYSNCNQLDVMFYVVTPCSNLTDIIEEREYQCLGQWEEDGQLMAYVKRKDATFLSQYECFVGDVDNYGNIYLMESGLTCQRNLRVIESGMKLTKQSNCFGLPGQNESKPWFVPIPDPPAKNPLKIAVIRIDDIQVIDSQSRTTPWTPTRGVDSSARQATSKQQWHLHIISVLLSVRVLFSV